MLHVQLLLNYFIFLLAPFINEPGVFMQFYHNFNIAARKWGLVQEGLECTVSGNDVHSFGAAVEKPNHHLALVAREIVNKKYAKA